MFTRKSNSIMARQLDNWIETAEVADPTLPTLVLQRLPTPFPLEWYRSNPRLAMDRLMEFEGRPDYTPYYDEGDL